VTAPGFYQYDDARGEKVTGRRDHSVSPAAMRLYHSLGFVAYGTEPCALKLGDQYLDEDLMILRLR